jgi:hypothetical protein
VELRAGLRDVERAVQLGEVLTVGSPIGRQGAPRAEIARLRGQREL